ncbi:MAG: flagellar type III secretion system protein FlhB [Cypionkella sp.]|nr:flagellar type III secretion system protein FlhB [Cypionkella sp.]
MSEDDSSEKEFDASQRKLDAARARGEIPKSQDLTTAAAFFGLAIATVTFGGSGVVTFGNAFISTLGQADRLAVQITQSQQAPIGAIGWAFAAPSLPIFLIPAVVVLMAIFAQRAMHFSPEKLQLKLSRISPLANAKQKFGLAGMVDFGKNAAKMAAIGTLLSMYLILRAPNVMGSIYLDTATSMALMLRLFIEFLFLVLLISTVFGAGDYMWQRAQHAQRNRMSRKEMMDEMKDSEGDPHMKHARRSRGVEIATNQMIAEVGNADVVIVNPTHYAVALKWSREKGAAPTCLAKGVDEVAARIRKAAASAMVPIHSDPPTARALYASVDLGAEIRPEHYRAVAAAIRFAEKMRKLAKARGQNFTKDNVDA